MAIDWTNENVVPYLTELAEKLIRYELVTSVTKIILCILACAVFWGLRQFSQKQSHKYPMSDWDEAATGFFGAFVIALVVTCIMVTSQLFDIIACSTFPEKVILEYVMSFSKRIPGGFPK